MENLKKELNIDANKPGLLNNLHFHSYAIFLFAVILGSLFDIGFHFNVFGKDVYQYIGIGMIFLGTTIIYWAQSTTHYLKKKDSEKDINFFLHGPYKYTRNPTNLGITLMSLGLGLLINSLFSIIFTIITYLISRFIFIKRQDVVLEKRYGNVFIEYKKKVKDWL